jgi:hypothetical protein
MSQDPNEICEKFVAGIDSVPETELVALLNQKCQLGRFWEDAQLDPSLEFSVIEFIESAGKSFFCEFLDCTFEDMFMLLAKLAIAEKKNVYNLVCEDFKKYLCEQSIALPDVKVSAVKNEFYETAVDPAELRNRISSSAEVASAFRAWPLGDEGYLEPYSDLLSAFFESGEAKYDLNELSYDKITSAIHRADGEIELELKISGLCKESREQFSFSNASKCTGSVYGERLRDPEIFFIQLELN